VLVAAVAGVLAGFIVGSSRLPQPGGALAPMLPPSHGATYYISVGGSDANPGTARRPWRTIQKALSTLRPGDTAFVHAGTYRAGLIIRQHGRPSAPITLAAYPHETVVLSAPQTARNNYPVQITGSYIRLHGFVIEGGTGTSDANVYLWGGAHNVEISGDEVRYGQDQGIFADKTTRWLYIVGNWVHDNGWHHLPGQHDSHGIYVEGGGDLIADNVIYNHAYGFGIQIYPVNHGTVVAANTIVASGHSSIVVGGAAGVADVVIRNNILYDDNWGVEVTSNCPTGRVEIDHNVIDNYRVAPIQSGCPRVKASDNFLADPWFADYPMRDLHLDPASAASDAGAPGWSPPRDIEGRPRPTDRPPDIGAYEG
jgi:hypothetical protein